MVTFSQEMNFTAPTSLHFTTGFLFPIIVMFLRHSTVTIEVTTTSVVMLTTTLSLEMLFKKSAMGIINISELCIIINEVYTDLSHLSQQSQ